MTDTGIPPPDRLARAYARILAAADAAHDRRLLVAAIAAPLVTLLIAVINRYVLLGFPNSGDEYNYLYAAETFAAGRLWNPPSSSPELFALNYLVQEPSREFSSFPFGWPLLLTLARRAGLPVWLVNPLLGTLTLALVWALGTRLYGGRIGVLTAVVVAVSPFFLFNAASFFSHTFCGVLLAGAALTASAADRDRAAVPLVVGFLIGWAVVSRYLTGAVCGIPILLWLLRPGVRRGRALLLVMAGGLPWVLALAAYNQAMTGSALRLTTTPLTISLWFREGFVLRSADILSTHLLRHLLWTPPVLVFAYVVYLRMAPRETRRPPLEWMLAVVVAVLYFYVERGGNQYGPRFHYEAFLFVALFVTANVFHAPALPSGGRFERVMFALLAASVLMMPVALAVHARVEREVIVERMDPFTQAARAGLRDALVVIGDRVGSARSMAPADLVRNGIDYSGPVLFGIDPGDDVLLCLYVGRVVGRRPYRYIWDHAAGYGTLSELQCPLPGGK